MGNYLQRENRWQQDTQEVTWNLRLQNAKQKRARKRICIFKTSQDSQKKSKSLPFHHIYTDPSAYSLPMLDKGTTSSPSKDNGNQTYADEVCYVLINHTSLRKIASGNSAEEEVTGELYENISCKANRPGESLGGIETEYSLLRVPSTPRHPPYPEDEYALLMPRPSPSSLRQQRPRVAPFETQFSHLQ
ncbi:germinal center-associated signaling and motility protein [Octodon degus]|uniref:Germinal center-associated signaling and motility protein n=1 Tax=Octodon degus TaxID=10160 RepID=A0A6P6DA93_OCTDE|nr:germinal center-associated signaling and motility protein [Octodon degus]